MTGPRLTGPPAPSDIIERVLRADRTLCTVAMALDYLLAVTPVDIPEAWKTFRAGGYRTDPVLRYRPLSPELPRLRRLLEDLPLKAVEDQSLQTLLAAKRRELQTQIRSLEGRGTPRFLEASLALYGGVDDSLLELAEQVLARAIPRSRSMPPARSGGVVGARTFARRARLELQRYRQAYRSLESGVEVRDDIPGVMAFEGNLLVGAGIRVPAARVEALIQHEVGTHLVTHANPAGPQAQGHAQGVRRGPSQRRSGQAHRSRGARRGHAAQRPCRRLPRPSVEAVRRDRLRSARSGTRHPRGERSPRPVPGPEQSS